MIRLSLLYTASLFFDIGLAARCKGSWPISLEPAEVRAGSSAGEVLGLVELPIAGLMDALTAEEMSAKVHHLEDTWAEIGCTMPSPFMTMALIPLACLPELRLTNRGLVDCTTFQFTDLVVDGEAE